MTTAIDETEDLETCDACGQTCESTDGGMCPACAARDEQREEAKTSLAEAEEELAELNRQLREVQDQVRSAEQRVARCNKRLNGLY
jgi:septal ring factor EnvC (AmiA/AmiB activator)